MTTKPFNISILFFALFLFRVVFPLPIGADVDAFLSQNAGPIIVRNGKTPAFKNGKPETVTLKNDLILGEDQDNSDSSFSILNYFAIDELGKIYVMDQKEFRVKVFSPSGTFLKSFGRRGQGPGEFQSPARINFTSDGTLVIQEFLGGRLHYFSVEGKWLKDIPYPTLDLSGFCVDSRGFFYSTIATRDVKTTKFELMKFDAGLHPIKSITSIEWPRLYKMVSFGFPSLYFDVNRRDELVWANSGNYVIHVVDANGELCP